MNGVMLDAQSFFTISITKVDILNCDGKKNHFYMTLLFTQPLLASITKYYLKNCEKHCDNLI